MAESLALLLRCWGHEVGVAYDGPAALAAARAHPAEVILLDVGLPGMTGYQVAQQLRGEEGLEATLVVALTGYGREEDRCRSREAGVDHHLTKPVEPDTLGELLVNPGAFRSGRAMTR
jgi:CheY-like chemotaxis protein